MLERDKATDAKAPLGDADPRSPSSP